MAAPRRFVLFLLLVGCSMNAFCQEEEKDEKEGRKKQKEDPRNQLLGLDTQWSEGSAMLDDGTELKGVLKFNENTGVLSIDAGKDSRSLTARSCLGFEFYDVVAQKQRLFYALEFKNEEGIVLPTFFEALFQFKSFAVLRKSGVLKIKEKTYYNNPLTPATDVTGKVIPRDMSRIARSTRVDQDETIYLMSEGGEIKMFIEISTKDRVIDELDIERSKIHNEDFLEQLVGTAAYVDMEKYRRENGLSYKERDQLIQLFEYYQDKWAP